MRQWLTDLTLALAQQIEPAEEAVTRAYISMHLLEWNAGGERRYILFCRGRFEIAAVEKRTDQGDTPSFRIEIRDRFSDEIIAGRPCNDLEHAAEIFTTLKNAVLAAFMPI